MQHYPGIHLKLTFHCTNKNSHLIKLPWKGYEPKYQKSHNESSQPISWLLLFKLYLSLKLLYIKKSIILNFCNLLDSI